MQAVCRLGTRQNVVATLIDVVHPGGMAGVRGKLETEAWQPPPHRSFLDPGIEVYPMHDGVMGPQLDEERTGLGGTSRVDGCVVEPQRMIERIHRRES